MPAGARNTPTRQDTWSIVVKYRGNTTGFWDKKTGGAVDSDETKYYPGHMEDPLALGGRKTTDNLTLSRIYDRIDDHDLINDLIDGVGRSHVTVEVRPMDFEGHGFGKIITYNGILKRVVIPDTDSESSGAAMIEIEVAVIGFPHAA